MTAILPLSALRADTANVRAQLGDLAGLASSIRQLGLIQPLTVRPCGSGDYIVVDGHRRFAAARQAGVETVPVFITDMEDKAAITVAQTAANFVRAPMSEPDTWRAVSRMMAEGFTLDAAAAALGLEERRVRRLSLLGKLLPTMLDAMQTSVPRYEQLATIAAAPAAAQKEVWKKHRPAKGSDPNWHAIAHALTVKRLGRSTAMFTDEIARKHGVSWEEDLFAAAEEEQWTTGNVAGFMYAPISKPKGAAATTPAHGHSMPSQATSSAATRLTQAGEQEILAMRRAATSRKLQDEGRMAVLLGAALVLLADGRSPSTRCAFLTEGRFDPGEADFADRVLGTAAAMLGELARGTQHRQGSLDLIGEGLGAEVRWPADEKGFECIRKPALYEACNRAGVTGYAKVTQKEARKQLVALLRKSHGGVLTALHLPDLAWPIPKPPMRAVFQAAAGAESGSFAKHDEGNHL